MTRRGAKGLCLVFVFVAAGVCGQIWWSASRAKVSSNSNTPNASSVNPAPRRTATIATTLEVGGIVEHRPPGGTWAPLGIGSQPDISDEIRTGPASRARLQLGDRVTVELADNTGINVAQLSETLSRVRLQDGRVISEVRPGPGFLFHVQVQGNNAEAETDAGRFAVLKRGSAPAVFASEQGALVVSGAGKSVTLTAGEQTMVFDNAAPSPPTRLPSSLLLKLGQPPPARTRSKQLQIKGETSPGAVVRVRNQWVTPDQAGRFASSVALVDGPNEIFVEAEDILGRKQTAKVRRINVDANAPPVVGKVVW